MLPLIFFNHCPPMPQHTSQLITDILFFFPCCAPRLFCVADIVVSYAATHSWLIVIFQNFLLPSCSCHLPLSCLLNCNKADAVQLRVDCFSFLHFSSLSLCCGCHGTARYGQLIITPLSTLHCYCQLSVIVAMRTSPCSTFFFHDCCHCCSKTSCHQRNQCQCHSCSIFFCCHCHHCLTKQPSPV